MEKDMTNYFIDEFVNKFVKEISKESEKYLFMTEKEDKKCKGCGAIHHIILLDLDQEGTGKTIYSNYCMNCIKEYKAKEQKNKFDNGIYTLPNINCMGSRSETKAFNKTKMLEEGSELNKELRKFFTPCKHYCEKSFLEDPEHCYQCALEEQKASKPLSFEETVEVGGKGTPNGTVSFQEVVEVGLGNIITYLARIESKINSLSEKE